MPPDKTEKQPVRKQPYFPKPLTREKTWGDDLKKMKPSENPPLRNQQLLADSEQPVAFQHIDIHDSEQQGLFIFGVMQGGETICVEVTGYEGILADELDYPSHFMEDKQIVALSWLELPAHSFTNAAERRSTCQYELVARHTDITVHAREGDWARMAPLRIISFDIETMVPDDNTFPNPNTEADSVIQIATMMSIIGADNFNEPKTRFIYTIGGCNQDALNASLTVFETEHDLIQAWFDLVAELDADIITGYNILSFDIPYLIRRMTRAEEMRDLPGRMESPAPPTYTWNRTAGAPPPLPPPPFIGRPTLDMYWYLFKANDNRNPGKLNLAAQRLLGIQKEDMSYERISGLQRESDETRTRLALYCLKDTFIPLGLIGASNPFSGQHMLRRRPLQLLFPVVPRMN